MRISGTDRIASRVHCGHVTVAADPGMVSVVVFSGFGRLSERRLVTEALGGTARELRQLPRQPDVTDLQQDDTVDVSDGLTVAKAVTAAKGVFDYFKGSHQERRGSNEAHGAS